MSCYVRFDETCFPYESPTRKKGCQYDFLDVDTESSPIFKAILESPPATTTTQVATQPHPEAPTQTAQAAGEVPRHAMSTRSKHGISKRKHIFSLHTQN